MSNRFPVPLATAAIRLSLSPRSLESPKRRKALGLVDVPAPPGGKGRKWVDADSLDAVIAARTAVSQALYVPPPPFQPSPYRQNRSEVHAQT